MEIQVQVLSAHSGSAGIHAFPDAYQMVLSEGVIKTKRDEYYGGAA